MRSRSSFGRSRPHSCAVRLAILTGHREFAVYYRLMPWDHAAPALVLVEGGGCVEHLDGAPYSVRSTSQVTIAARDLAVSDRVRAWVRSDQRRGRLTSGSVPPDKQIGRASGARLRGRTARPSRGAESMASGNTPDYRKAALDFAQSLAAGDYPAAYAMTSQAYRQTHTVDRLRIGFEAIVPVDWGAIGPIEVGETMTTWPGKHASDLGWAYVSVAGDMYSEAVTVVVTLEDGVSRIRDVEFGRP